MDAHNTTIALMRSLCQFVALNASDTAEAFHMLTDATSMCELNDGADTAALMAWHVCKGHEQFVPAGRVCSRCYTVGKHTCAGQLPNPEVML